jgi:DNA-binding LacI/PurR family transcriptional regulator
MLMQQSHPPSAIYAFNDKMAIGAMRWLKEHGYSIPEAISVVGFDNMPSADFIDIPLTTVNLCSEDIGQRAASLLLRIIEGNTPQKKEIELPTRLMIRQSTAMTGVARRE